jgi:type I restriction enzyme, S subunit
VSLENKVPGSKGEQLGELTTSPGSKGEQLEGITTSPGSKGEQLGEVTTSQGSKGEQLGEVTTSPGSKGEQLAKVTTSPGSRGEQLAKLTTSPGSRGEQLAKLTTSPGSRGEQLAKLTTSPRLRFSEFSGEWEEKTLGTISQLTDGVHFTPSYVEDGIPFWSVETISSKAKPKFITPEAHKEAIRRCKPEKNDILLTRIGTLGKVMLIDWNEEFSIYVSLALIKKSSFFESSFMNFYLQTPYYKKELNKKSLSNTIVKISSIQEQTKIANFLTLVEQKISLQEQKLNLEIEFKKGLIQKIFSQQLRFKDENGDDYEEWEEVKLGNISSIVTGTTPLTKVKEYYDGEYLWVTPSDIKGDVYINETNKKLSKLGLEKSRFVPKGSVLVTCIASIGKNTIITRDGSCNQQINAILPSKSHSSEFIYYLMCINTNLLKEHCGKGTMEMLNKEVFSNISFNLPTLPEQTKIANLLTLQDKKISLHQQKLSLLNQYKKGLLQQMFV